MKKLTILSLAIIISTVSITPAIAKTSDTITPKTNSLTNTTKQAEKQSSKVHNLKENSIPNISKTTKKKATKINLEKKTSNDENKNQEKIIHGPTMN